MGKGDVQPDRGIGHEALFGPVGQAERVDREHSGREGPAPSKPGFDPDNANRSEVSGTLVSVAVVNPDWRRRFWAEWKDTYGGNEEFIYQTLGCDKLHECKLTVEEAHKALANNARAVGREPPTRHMASKAQAEQIEALWHALGLHKMYRHVDMLKFTKGNAPYLIGHLDELIRHEAEEYIADLSQRLAEGKGGGVTWPPRE